MKSPRNSLKEKGRLGKRLGWLLAGFALSATGQVVVDPNAGAGNRPGLDQAPNGVPIVNIATPNANGLSHNLYSDYNVGSGGLILNNLTGSYGNSQLGGVIFGNANLTNGAASRILNEVTGTKRSELLGFTEVAGQSAHVIVANPNGIYINGAGFINTPRVTLTTGKPEIDGSGGLIAYRVEQGNILVEGAGLNGMETDAFDLISRTASFAADVHVKGEMRVVAGRNRVNAENLDATELADDGSEKPVVAIDSSQLGGMYAGKIKLLATEKGVGVNMQGAVAASAGDLIAQAKGNVKVRRASAAAGKVRIQSDEGNVEVTEQIAATGRVELKSQTGEVKIASGAQVASAEALLFESGKAVRIETGGIANSYGKIEVNAASLSNDGELVASTQLNLVLSEDISNTGILGANQHVSIVAANLQNSNRILSNGTMNFQIGNSLTNNGQIQAQLLLSGAVAGNTTNRVDGLIQSGKVLMWETGSLQNEGRILAGESATLETAAALINSGKIAAQDYLSINAGNLENRSELLSLGALQLRVTGDLVNSASIDAVALNAEIGGKTTNQTGAKISTGQSLVWNSSGIFSNAGDVVSEASATIFSGQGIDNQTGGQFHAETLLSLETSALVQNSSVISSTSDLRVTAQNLVNPYGRLIFAGNNLILSVAQDVNNAGTLFAGNAMVVGLDGSLTNTGNLLATGDIVVQNRAGTGRAAAIINSSATIDSRNGSIILRGDVIENKRTELVIQRDSVDLGLGEIEVINNFQFPLIYGTWNVTNAYDIPESFWEDAPYEEFRFSKYYGKRPIEERTNNLYVQEHRYEDVVIADSGAATIRAGKDIIFDANTILNQSSVVSASGDIDIQAGSLTNQGDALLNRVETTSRQEYFVVKLKEQYSGRDRWKRQIIDGTEVYDVHHETAQSFSATLEAGGTIRGNIDALENSDVRTGATIDPGTGIIPSFIRPDENPPTSLGGDLDTSLNFLGSLSQLLIENTDPQAKYLYETREEFSRLGRFLGSDYFFDHLGLETGATEKLLKRLGDAYFETQYVLRQLYELTGRTMLGAPETDLALMQRLMDNGIASARDLQLTPGIALTKEQFNQLDQDIIWMEQRVVNGQRVMVPVVYLAPSTLKELGKSSATIAATNIDLKTGSLVNSGTFAAREILKLDTQSLLNFGGSLLSEGSLLVSSAGDIINRSGTISGSSVGLFAGGNILNTTDSVQRIDGTGALANSHTQFGNTGSISSTGDLALKAEGDIRNLGANLSTKGNATLQAGQDIEIGGIAATSEIHVRGPGMTLDLNQTGHLGSQLDIGQNLTLSAGQDVTLAGADVAVGGDATLAAGRDLSITTLTDTLQASGMVKGAGVKFSTATDRTTEIGTLLTTGGNLTLASGNDLTVRGSEIEAGKAITLAADGDDPRVDCRDRRRRCRKRLAGSGRSFGRQSGQSVGAIV